ncbi:MAG: protoporphyrinogen oxidase [Myxococcota bacterium]
MTRVVVIGAGITGLAAAHRLLELAREREERLDVCCLEASGRPGGLLESERTDEGYLIEHGPDAILTSKPAALKLAERLGLEDRIVRTRPENRGAFVVRGGRLERVPAGFQVVAPTKLGALWRSPVLTRGAKLRASLEPLLPRGPAAADESLGSFVRRRFGPEILERLSQPMAGGIYGAPPDRLSLRATMPRFLDVETQARSVTLGLRAQARREGTADEAGARYGLFISFGEGVEVLPRALAERLGDRLRLHAPVRAIAREGQGWRVALEVETLAADGVIVALPAPRAAPLVRPHLPASADQLDAVRHGSAATVTLAFAREDVAHPLGASGFVVPAVEGRVLLAATWASEKWPDRAPPDRVLIRVFLGGNDREEVAVHGEEELVAAARRGLRELMGIEAPPLLQRVDRYLGNMPRYELGHGARMDQVEAEVRRLPSLELAGNAYRGVGIPDSIASGERAAEALLAQLSGPSRGVSGLGTGVSKDGMA